MKFTPIILMLTRLIFENACNSQGNIRFFEVHLVSQTHTNKKCSFSFGKMCKSKEKCDLALRFKTRFGGFGRSGITLAVVWRTQVRGTRRRRVVKRGLHISATFFHCFFEAKVVGKEFTTNRPRNAGPSFFRKICVKVDKQRTGLQPQHPTR